MPVFFIPFSDYLKSKKGNRAGYIASTIAGLASNPDKRKPGCKTYESRNPLTRKGVTTKLPFTACSEAVDNLLWHKMPFLIVAIMKNVPPLLVVTATLWEAVAMFDVAVIIKILKKKKINYNINQIHTLTSS
jgi:hypothetical protein